MDNFISASFAVILLRISLAIIFLTHSLVRIANSSIGQFGEFMESKGFPFGIGWVWAITAFEIIGGVLLAAGYFTKILSAIFIAILVFGIILIHSSLGWFVGEHGTGGSEYSFILIMSLLTVAAADTDKSFKK